ncbi:MAG: hypothetical protein JWM04_2134 [Verrucomicrobiales bacterium]|nr:hypothetical protein [Verrucomicrobiales bacterium]
MNLQTSIQEQVLHKLNSVSIAARQAVESILSGQHKSIRRGLSIEFANHRPYVPGDDIRHLDWFVYARSDRYDVRVYEEETKLRATIILDASGSMGYGSHSRTKWDFARDCAAALSFLMLRQSDSVGLSIFDSTVHTEIPAGSTMGHLISMLNKLEETKPGNETDLAPVLMQAASRLKRRGLVILITDGFDKSEAVIKALSYLRHKKQEVWFFQILDPNELTFSMTGVLEFQGLEKERKLKLDADRIRHLYQEALLRHNNLLAEGCHALGIRRYVFQTNEDLANGIIMALKTSVAQVQPRA